MARVTVNGVDESFVRVPGTVGGLLEEIERRCETRGEVMTAVSCDGLESSAFRDAAFARRPLADLELVEVEAAKPRDLLLASLDEVGVALGALQRAASRLAGAFRDFDVSAANRDLAQFAQSLSTLVALTSAVAAAVSVDLTTVGSEATSGVNLVDELSDQTEAVIAAQQAKDWIRVADTIEHDIGSTLRRWPTILASLRLSVSDVFIG